MLPKVTLIYNRYKTASLSKEAVVEIRITYNKRQKYISTGIKVYPNQWKEGIIINHQNSILLNKTLDKLLSNIRQIIYDMSLENSIDIFSIPSRLQKLSKANLTFIDYCKQRATIRKYGKKIDTQQRYDRFIKFIENYGKLKEFNDITEEAIITLDKELSRKNLKVQSKWHGYHMFINSFIIDAINEGLLYRNPYKWICISKEEKTETIKKCLTLEEFDKIKSTKMPTESLTKVQDLFIFQTYTCLSYTDLKDFDINQIVEIKGMKVYKNNRNKTNKNFTIPLLEEALNILKKYNNSLPIISNVKYNLYLKAVAQYAKINREISSHWARHTGATLLLNKGVSLQIVSKICGHSSIKITEQIYAKLFDESVVDAITKIKDTI